MPKSDVYATLGKQLRSTFSLFCTDTAFAAGALCSFLCKKIDVLSAKISGLITAMESRRALEDDRYDRETIKALAEAIGSADLLAMIRQFVAVSEADCSVIELALTSVEEDEARKAAHRIAGAALSLGLREVASSARKIEYGECLKMQMLEELRIQLDDVVKGLPLMLSSSEN